MSTTLKMPRPTSVACSAITTGWFDCEECCRSRGNYDHCTHRCARKFPTARKPGLSGLFTFPSTINWNTTDWHPDIFIQPGGGFWSQHGWDVFGAGASTLATILGNRQKQKQQAQVDPISAYMPMLMIGGMVTVLVVALVAGGKK